MKAYVITQGNYSDYRIVGVALDYDIACAILKMKCSDHGRIEEYDIYEDKTLIDATKDYVKNWKIIFGADGVFKDAVLERWTLEPSKPRVVLYNSNHVVYVCDNDLERAKKTAIDARSMALARQFGLNIS